MKARAEMCELSSMIEVAQQDRLLVEATAGPSTTLRSGRDDKGRVDWPSRE
jgi:hypothetical protein